MKDGETNKIKEVMQEKQNEFSKFLTVDLIKIAQKIIWKKSKKGENYKIGVIYKDKSEKKRENS